jgi:two-component system chemotaxis sensor kinase CheA
LDEIYKKKKQAEKKELEKGVLVIVESDSSTAALFVDEIIGQQEIVIKGLSKILGSIRGISGCTVLGNGEVSLITDVGGLIRRASEKWI